VKEGEYQQQRVLYVISCGSPVAQHIPEFVMQAQAADWDVCVITTPHGRNFLDSSSLESLTGHPVRSRYKHPDEPDLLPRADALITFPATFNTLNKRALGITDTLAVGLLCEYTGLKKPIIAVPVTGEGLNSHPALVRSIRMLRRYGVHVLYEPEASPLQGKDASAMILSLLEKYVGK
jgi:phosphopantothenoylcysteine synthetase/decarboxylase